MWEFEYDRAKSQQNREKHGIDFEEAQALRESVFVEIHVPHTLEERFLHVGLIDEKFWTAVITKRGKKIRIISVRRSRGKEVKEYEQGNKRQTH